MVTKGVLFSGITILDYWFLCMNSLIQVNIIGFFNITRNDDRTVVSGGFFSENGSAAHMTHHCTVYYRDVLVTVPGGVTFISLLVLLSTMSSIGGRSGWKGTVCPRLIPLSHSLLHSKEHFFRSKHIDGFFCPVRYMIQCLYHKVL